MTCVSRGGAPKTTGGRGWFDIFGGFDYIVFTIYLRFPASGIGCRG